MLLGLYGLLTRFVPVALIAALAGCSGDAPAAAHSAAAGVGSGAGGGGAGGAGAGGAAGASGTHADGTVGPWQELAPMPEARANHCSAVVGDFIVVVGGNSKPSGSPDFVTSDAVHAARLQPDGALGAWQTAGKAPSPVTECTIAARGSTVLLIDGIYATDTDGSQVWATELSADGMLGTWSSLGKLPAGQRMLSSEATVVDSSLAVMTTQLPDAGDAVLLYRSDLTSGLGPWSSDAWLPGFRAQAMFAFATGYVYALGGYLGPDQMNEVVPRVDGAPRGADAAVGPAFMATAMPTPIAFGEAVAVDDYLFVVGGKTAIFAPAGEATVISTHVAADGTLAPWAEQAPLPEARTNHDMVLAGDWLYVAGGGSDGPGLDSVFAARVRF